MLIFFDTEFTTLGPGAELLSIGLVSEDGAHQLYLERSDFDPEICSDFVLKCVIPHFSLSFVDQIDVESGELELEKFSALLEPWLAKIPGPLQFACDSWLDFRFLSELLSGAYPPHCHPRPLIIGAPDPNDWDFFVGAYFALHRGELRHHALCDARAIRDAWLRVGPAGRLGVIG